MSGTPLRNQWVLFREGLRLAWRSSARRWTRKGPTRHSGSAPEICRKIVDDCWNGHYFCAGLDHLDQFWLRDIAISLEGLIDLGQSERVVASLEWALERYARAGRITTTIFQFSEPVDIFTYSSDSLPFLLYSLERLGLTALRARYGELLRRELALYADSLLKPRSRELRLDRMFSSVKDTMHFVGTCTTATMVAWCAELVGRCPELQGQNPFAGMPLRAQIIEWFWTGSYFRNDVDTTRSLCSADANFWPYWCGLVEDPEKLALSFRSVRERGLDHPFPLKYHDRRFPELELGLQRFFLPNYQGDAIWTFFTPQWLELLARVDRPYAQELARQYAGLVERHGTWFEVFAPDGSGPLRGRFGHGSDWGMIWAASLPRVLRLLEQ